MKLHIINNFLVEIDFKIVEDNEDLKKKFNIERFSYRRPNTDEMNRLWDEFIKIAKNEDNSDIVSSTYSVKSALGKELQNIGREFTKAYFGNLGLILINKLESLMYKDNFIKKEIPNNVIADIVKKIKRVVDDNNKDIEDLEKFIFKVNSVLNSYISLVPIEKDISRKTVRFFVNGEKSFLEYIKYNIDDNNDSDNQDNTESDILKQYKIYNELDIDKFNHIFNKKVLSDLLENKPKYKFHIYLNKAFKTIFKKRYKSNEFLSKDNKKYFFIVDVDKLIESKDIVVVSDYILILFYDENDKVNKLKLIKYNSDKFDEFLLQYLKKSEWGKNIKKDNAEEVKKENKYIKKFDKVLNERFNR